jgi:predicted amidohydrolase
MKICAAQIKPLRGNIQINIANHKELTQFAVSNGVGLIVFPELSLTGYEPKLADELATKMDDERFDDFQAISNNHQISIAVGIPLRAELGTLISMIIFQPNKCREIYSKQHLHRDELPYFINGQGQLLFTSGNSKIAPAICYELSVPEHSKNAFAMGAEIYIASVAKSADGVKEAITTLSDIAQRYSMTVLMSNCIGFCDGVECAGQTSIWNSNGVLAGQLDDKNEGLLIIDTDTQQVIRKAI